MEKKLGVKFQVPTVPNFLTTRGGEVVVRISEFTEEELRMVGEEWTMALILKAKLPGRKASNYGKPQ